MTPSDEARAASELTAAKLDQLKIDQKVSCYIEKTLMSKQFYQFQLKVNTSLDMFKEAMNAGRRTRQS